VKGVKAAPPAQLPPLLRAIVTGDTRTALTLIRTAPAERIAVSPGWAWLPRLKIGYARGDTPLHLAARRGNATLVRRLLDKRVDPNASNGHGHRPLHAAVTCLPEFRPTHHQRQARIIRMLVNAGADPDARDLRAVAPLHTAVRVRCLASVRALLDSGALIRVRNGATGATPLHLAIRATGRGGSGSPAALAAQASIVKLLLGRGAMLSDRDRRGRTVSAWRPRPD